MRSAGTPRFGGSRRAVGLPLELAGRMRVGVDAEPAARVDGEREQPHRGIETFGPAVDLHRGVEVGARAEHQRRVEGRLGPPLADDEAPGAMAEHVDVGVRDRAHHPVGHRLRRHAQLRVHARDHHVELGEQLVGMVERAVLEDVALDAGEDAERRELLVQSGDDVELLAQPLDREAARDLERRRMVGERE